MSYLCYVCEQVQVGVSGNKCAKCQKAHVPEPSQVPKAIPGIGETVDNYLRLMAEMQRRFEKEIESDGKYNSKHNRELTLMLRAGAALIKEARAYEEATSRRAGDMSTDEMKDLMLKFYRKLPDEDQREMFKAITRAFNERPRGIQGQSA